MGPRFLTGMLETTHTHAHETDMEQTSGLGVPITRSRACSCSSCCCKISNCLCSSSSCRLMYSWRGRQQRMQQNTTRGRGRERGPVISKVRRNRQVKCGRKEGKKIPQHLFTKQERYPAPQQKHLSAVKGTTAADGDSSMLCCDDLVLRTQLLLVLWLKYYPYIFYFWAMWHLSSQTRARTCAPCSSSMES